MDPDHLSSGSTSKYGVPVVPPAPSGASPAGVDARPGEDVPWWLPSHREIAIEFGWRWILFAPAAIILFAILLIPLRPGYAQLLVPFWKLIVILVGIPTALALRSMRTVVQRRTEPFCIHCGYALIGLPDGQRCPECGRQFSHAIIDEYRRDPRWFIKRWKMHHQLPRADVPFSAGSVRTKPSRDGT
ncbi:MAG: hypothetical protein ACREJC_22745 [Tepidisphaeraceae bacterium]